MHTFNFHIKLYFAGCVVSSESSEDIVVCLCDHLTSFGADFFVAPNPIDFAVIAKNIGNLANNLAVLLTLVGMFVLFIVGIVYFRREDKRDLEKVIFLCPYIKYAKSKLGLYFSGPSRHYWTTN